jgi:hypothetical protein
MGQSSKMIVPHSWARLISLLSLSLSLSLTSLLHLLRTFIMPSCKDEETRSNKLLSNFDSSLPTWVPHLRQQGLGLGVWEFMACRILLMLHVFTQFLSFRFVLGSRYHLRLSRVGGEEHRRTQHPCCLGIFLGFVSTHVKCEFLPVTKTTTIDRQNDSFVAWLVHDRLEWRYLKGVHLNYVESIMRCVDCGLTKPFITTWGIHQGDPISPYLFLLCSEGFSCLLQQKS